MTTAEDTGIFVTGSVLPGGIGHVVFANPRRRNALGSALLGAMSKELDAFAKAGVSVVVLTSGIGQAVWSAGFDIGEMASDRDPIASGKPLERFLQQIRSYPGAVIAMVSGSVWGGAVDMVMSCDLVIADRTALFAMTPASIGLPYSMSGLIRFINSVPIHVLKEMFLGAVPLDAERAERFGVINYLVTSDSLEAKTIEVARNIGRKAPMAVRAVKEQLRILEDFQPLPVQAMERVAELRRQACEGEDFSEGLAAFLTRRQPVFQAYHEDAPDAGTASRHRSREESC